jgi:hypothetical protein
MLLKKGLVISGGFRARRAPTPAIRSAANEPNTGFIVPLLKPFADRTRAADMAQLCVPNVWPAPGLQVDLTSWRAQSAAMYPAREHLLRP